jgi:hypothetical protein
MNKSLTILALTALVILTGCSRANQAAIGAWGQDHHIKQFSGSVLIGEWDSTGKVNNDGENGYSFQDKATNLNVRISGHVTITVN